MVQIGILLLLIHFCVLLSMMCSGQNHTNPTQNYSFVHNSFNVAGNQSQSVLIVAVNLLQRKHDKDFDGLNRLSLIIWKLLMVLT